MNEDREGDRVPTISLRCACGWESKPFALITPCPGGTLIYRCGDCESVLGIQELVGPNLEVLDGG